VALTSSVAIGARDEASIDVFAIALDGVCCRGAMDVTGRIDRRHLSKRFDGRLSILVVSLKHGRFTAIYNGHT
jgi:hypothetical protein